MFSSTCVGSGYTPAVTEVAEEVARPDPAAQRSGDVQRAGRERIARRQVDKFAERRDQLADVALATLAELGYARTSLRDIAQNSDFSHGVLHYYFSDKIELITHCVRRCKAECVTRYDEVVATAASAAELRDGFAGALAATLREDTATHRLWYDLRNQSMFDDSFRRDVLEIDRSLEAMIWRVVSRYAELAGAPVAVTESVAYAIFDGLFQQALIQHVTQPGAGAGDRLAASAAGVLESLIVAA
jgi:AcrR family transcriptional regulator